MVLYIKNKGTEIRKNTLDKIKTKSCIKLKKHYTHIKEENIFIFRLMEFNSVLLYYLMSDILIHPLTDIFTTLNDCSGLCSHVYRHRVDFDAIHK